MTWILTQSGQQFDLLRPTASMIKPTDIAHALSRLCRFNGHTRAHYSVAQHSMIVAGLVPVEHQLVALLHDAPKAYIGDMTRPLKAVMPEYHYIEQLIWLAVCERFDIQIDLPACVRLADMVALATERRDLMPAHPGEWECMRGVQPMKETIVPFSAESASMMFFSQLMALMQSNHRRRLSV